MPGQDPDVPTWPSDIAAMIPVYNHADRVGGVVAGLRALGARVLAVDDGSNDGSGDSARAAGAEVLVLGRNHGKGTALANGLGHLAASGHGAVVSVDADGQHAAADALRLALAAADDPEALHIGVRDMAPAPWTSRLGRRLSNSAVRLCCGIAPGDSQSGLRAYPVQRVLGLAVRAGGYAWEVEVIVRAARAGIPIRQVPVAVAYPGDRVSHFGAVRDSLHLCGVVARLAVGR